MARKLTRAQTINRALRNVPPWPIYLAGAGWAAWQFWLALNGVGKYAVEPINVLEREYGLRALQLMVAVLAVTPLFTLTKVSLFRFRRALGLTAFLFVFAHFSIWAVLDLGTVDRIWTEIAKRPYITIGFLAFVLLIPLAVTSNDWSVRRFGRGWDRLHRLVYAIGLLGALHFLWLVKGIQLEPVLYSASIVVLLALRISPAWLRGLFGARAPA